MEEPYDPWSARLNTELADLLLGLRADWSAFERAKTLAGRKERAASLAMKCEMFVVEPAFWPADLQPDAADDAGMRLTVQDFGTEAPAFGELYPFDDGAPLGHAFFHTGLGSFSPLYPPPAQDPCQQPLLHHYGFSHALTLVHVTLAATMAHAVRLEPFRWVVEQTPLSPTEPEQPHFAILVDARGVSPELRVGAQLLAHTSDREAAIAAATEWAALLSIRMAVATIDFAFDGN